MTTRILLWHVSIYSMILGNVFQKSKCMNLLTRKWSVHIRRHPRVYIFIKSTIKSAVNGTATANTSNSFTMYLLKLKTRLSGAPGNLTLPINNSVSAYSSISIKGYWCNNLMIRCCTASWTRAAESLKKHFVARNPASVIWKHLYIDTDRWEEPDTRDKAVRYLHNLR